MVTVRLRLTQNITVHSLRGMLSIVLTTSLMQNFKKGLIFLIDQGIIFLLSDYFSLKQMILIL